MDGDWDEEGVCVVIRKKLACGMGCPIAHACAHI